MPPRKSKAKLSEDDAAEQTPVRRSARTRRSVIQDESEDIDVEPPKKRARSSRASASAAINYEEEENSSEPLKDLKNDEFDPRVDQDQQEDEKSITPVKVGRGRGRKASEHKDTPHPKAVAAGRGGRTRKRRDTSETLGEVNEQVDATPDVCSAPKKSKLDLQKAKLEEDEKTDTCKGETTTTESSPKKVSSESEPASNASAESKQKSKNDDAVTAGGDGEKLEQKKPSKQEIQPKESSVDRDSAAKSSSEGETSVTNGVSAAKVKQPTGVYEENVKTGDVKKELTVASVVNTSDAVSGGETTKASLEKLENPDIVAIQKSTPAVANVAETCGFKVVGDGSTRLLLKNTGSNNVAAHIEVIEPPETQSLVFLALSELEGATSKSNKKRVEEYLAKHCAPTDEFTVVTLAVNGKIVTLVNVQLESKNYAVSSLLIGCLMRKLDSRSHAFILTGYMPHVRPGTPAYELLRDGYFGNHSIDTLQSMRDIKMDDEEELNKGLIDFFWKAYQHSRPWMRSVYETVLDGESVVSATGNAVIWHSTEGVEAVRVLNHARIVKADLAIRKEVPA